MSSGATLSPFATWASSWAWDATRLGDASCGPACRVAGEIVDPADFQARFVRFDILSNHQGNLTFGVGLSEVQFFSTPAAAVPEPSMLLLLGSGLVGLAGWRWRKTRAVTS